MGDRSEKRRGSLEAGACFVIFALQGSTALFLARYSEGFSLDGFGVDISKRVLCTTEDSSPTSIIDDELMVSVAYLVHIPTTAVLFTAHDVYWLVTTFHCIMSCDDSIKTRIQISPYVRQTEARKNGPLRG